jgi:hypothetical protein
MTDIGTNPERFLVEGLIASLSLALALRRYAACTRVCRWVQLGALSPVFRTHGCRYTDIFKRIWFFEPQVRNGSWRRCSLLRRVTVICVAP